MFTAPSSITYAVQVRRPDFEFPTDNDLHVTSCIALENITQIDQWIQGGAEPMEGEEPVGELRVGIELLHIFVGSIYAASVECKAILRDLKNQGHF